ncbi:MAG: hypothetical protein Q4C42_06400 [Clostridia bacterium]|nr:hypothetical protein [Clostridia bacterium]
MYELIENSFYTVLQDYPDCVIDYCILKDDVPYLGEESHRKAINSGMEKCSSKVNGGWEFDINKAHFTEIQADIIFECPEKTEPQNFVDEKIPYWYAFLHPPHDTGFVIIDGIKLRDKYSKDDFERVNKSLFPDGTDNLIVYEWSTDWSEYFEPGHEWWGVKCLSIYDVSSDRYVVIMASATD